VLLSQLSFAITPIHSSTDLRFLSTNGRTFELNLKDLSLKSTPPYVVYASAFDDRQQTEALLKSESGSSMEIECTSNVKGINLHAIVPASLKKVIEAYPSKTELFIYHSGFLLTTLDKIAFYQNGRWSVSSFCPPGAASMWSFPRQIVLAQNNLNVLCFGGEYGDRIYSYDLTTHAWKLILSRIDTKVMSRIQNAQDSIWLFTENQIFRFDKSVAVATYALPASMHLRDAKAVDNSMILLDEDGALSRLEFPPKTVDHVFFISEIVPRPIGVGVKTEARSILYADNQIVALMESDAMVVRDIRSGKIISRLQIADISKSPTYKL
jgi:hypothetical protein